MRYYLDYQAPWMIAGLVVGVFGVFFIPTIYGLLFTSAGLALYCLGLWVVG